MVKSHRGRLAAYLGLVCVLAVIFAGQSLRTDRQIQDAQRGACERGNVLRHTLRQVLIAAGQPVPAGLGPVDCDDLYP